MSQKEIANIIKSIQNQIDIIKKKFDIKDELKVEKKSDSQYVYYIIKNDGEDMAIFNFSKEENNIKKIVDAIYELYSMDVFKAEAIKKFLEM